MKYYKCRECWELLAQYKNTNDINCENPTCELVGESQQGIELKDWELEEASK